MKNKGLVVLVASLLLVGGAVGANAQVRLDANIQWPFYLGINLENLTGGVQGTTEISKYAFLLPELEASYQFGGANLRGGIGLKAYTLIIESFGWPMAYLELVLDPIVLRAELGGGLFYAFGLASASGTARIIIPQLEVSWKLADWFRLGAGALFIAPFDAPSNFGVVGYLGGRFTFLFR